MWPFGNKRSGLEAALRDFSDQSAQAAAADALGKLGDPAAVPALEEAASEAFWAPRRDALARGYAGMGVGLDAARRRARKDEDLVRDACRRALAALDR